jgi:hypothetical protein
MRAREWTGVFIDGKEVARFLRPKQAHNLAEDAEAVGLRDVQVLRILEPVEAPLPAYAGEDGVQDGEGDDDAEVA